MKPLLVDLETAWRGGQNQFLLMLKGFRARGHEAELVAAEGSALAERAGSAGVPVHLASRRATRISAARKIRALLATHRFDLVHANESHALTAAWLARAQRTVPLFVSRRVGYPLGRSYFSRARFDAATKIVAISQWAAAQAIASGAPPDKVSIVYEGVDIPDAPSQEQRMTARAHWNIPAEAPLLGCVGVLSPDKGQEFLIRALADLRHEFPQARLLLAGDGPSRPHLEQLAKSLGLSEAVLFAGFVQDIDAVYRALDIFLLPSLFEALNNSLLAAMALQIPSIAFDGTGPSEIIEQERSGLLVPAKDVAAIVAAVSRILRDPQFAQALATSGRARVQQYFSAEVMVENMIALYEEARRGKEAKK